MDNDSLRESVIRSRGIEFRLSPDGSFNPQEHFLFFPINRKSDFQCCQRDVFWDGSDDCLMNDFRGEERQPQHPCTKSIKSKKSAENWNGLSRFNGRDRSICSFF